MTAIETYIKQFVKLNRSPGAVWSELTKRKAPHKPILLLAVIDLIHRGVITSPFIAVTGASLNSTSCSISTGAE